MTTPLTSSSGDVASTYGWDTVFAIPVKAVNAAITKAGCSPRSFSGTGFDAVAGENYTVSGTFGTWQVSLGGNDALINLEIPLPTLDFAGAFQFTGGQVCIQVKLHYLPRNPAPGATVTGTLHDLKVRTKKYVPAPAPGQPPEPVVTIESLSFPGTLFSKKSSDVSPVLEQWFNDHLEDFDHVFATVNLNRTADHGQFAWLLPTATSYAFDSPTTNATETNSFLGILNMTQGRSADGLSQQLSSNAIPNGSQAGFLISGKRLLTDLLLPGLPTVFPGCQVSDFKLASDDLSISLTAPVTLNPVTPTGTCNPNNESYETSLEYLNIGVQKQAITFSAETKVKVGTGIYSYKQVTSTYAINLVALPSGAQSLHFQLLSQDDIPPFTKTTEAAAIVTLVNELLVAVVAAVLIVLTDGAALAVGMVVMGLLGTLVGVTPKIVAALGTNDAPTLSLLAFNATDPLVWSDQQNFDLNFAGLNQSLQLGGTPHFV